MQGGFKSPCFFNMQIYWRRNTDSEKIQDGILAKAKQIYTEQKQAGTVFPYYCNFSKLEAACDAYGVAE